MKTKLAVILPLLVLTLLSGCKKTSQSEMIVPSSGPDMSKGPGYNAQYDGYSTAKIGRFDTGSRFAYTENGVTRAGGCSELFAQGDYQKMFGPGGTGALEGVARGYFNTYANPDVAVGLPQAGINLRLLGKRRECVKVSGIKYCSQGTKENPRADAKTGFTVNGKDYAIVEMFDNGKIRIGNSGPNLFMDFADVIPNFQCNLVPGTVMCNLDYSDN